MFTSLLFSMFFLIPAVVVGIWMEVVRKRHGYRSFREFSRATPVTESQQRDAVQFTVTGIVLCALGALGGMFAFLGFVGIFPLYHGARKVLYASLGLGLVNDADVRDR